VASIIDSWFSHAMKNVHFPKAPLRYFFFSLLTFSF
jgi:hypothetical protein